MSEPLRIVSIGAHPADVFDQSGGTMAHHAARGDYVACVVLTHGARVHDKVISDSMFHREEVPGGDELTTLMAERAEVKAEEVRRAGRILGFEDVYFFGADDAVLLVDAEIVKRLARLLRRIRPDIVLTHYPKEGDGLTNPHAIAGQTAVHAMSVAVGRRPRGQQPADIGSPHLLLRLRRGVAEAVRLGLRGRILQRRVRGHHGRGRQEARGPRLPGEPGLRRRLRQEAHRDQRRGVRDGCGSGLRGGIHRGPGRDPLLPARIGVLHAGSALVGPREDGAVLLPDTRRLGAHGAGMCAFGAGDKVPMLVSI